MQLKEKSPKAVISLPSGRSVSLMDQLARFAGEYRKSGGIHSAAVGQGRTILLYSEDVGRHNTLDRIAGEALSTASISKERFSLPPVACPPKW